MRIGMMVDVYKPYVSGITNYIDLNKRALESAGHEVYVFTFGDLEYQDDEPRVVRSPGLPVSDTGYYLSVRYKTQHKRLLRTMDVVHVHHPFISGHLALRYCRPVQIPIVFTNHARYDLYAQARFPWMPEEVSHGLLLAYMPAFCEAVDLVISPSRGMEKVLRQYGVESHIEVVPNGANLKPFRKAKPIARARFGFTKNDTILVYMGRIAPEKNLEFLINTFAGVARAIPNVYLLILGAGPKEYDDQLRALPDELQIAERVRLGLDGDGVALDRSLRVDLELARFERELEQPLHDFVRVEIRQREVQHHQRRLRPPDLEQRVHPARRLHHLHRRYQYFQQ